MKRIKKGDQVVVITGKNKGDKGEVLRVLDDKVVVQNVNMVKRHTKPNPQVNQPGGIVEKEAAISVSNVMLLNPSTNKGERVGFKILENGKKVRVYRSNGEVIDT